MKLDSNLITKKINQNETNSKVIQDFEDYEKIFEESIAEAEKLFKEEIERLSKSDDFYLFSEDVDDFDSTKLIALNSLVFAKAAQMAYDKLYNQLISSPEYINDLASRYASIRGATLVQGINSQVRTSIRETVSRGLSEGADVREVASRIKKTIGLDTRGTRAVGNLRSNLTKQGVNPVKIKKQVDAYAQKLLAERARLIAQTEIQTAIETAKLEVWKSSGRPVYVQWVTDTTACGKCAPSSGDITIAGNYFQTSLGGYQSPPLHPNCRCQLHEVNL